MVAMRLSIDGISNQQHARSAGSALESIPGVQSVDIRLECGEACVYYDPDKINPEQFRIALSAMSFTLTGTSRTEPVPPRIAEDRGSRHL